MKSLGLLLFILIIAACNVQSENPEPRFDVTLEPSQIAANVRYQIQVTPTQVPLIAPPTVLTSVAMTTTPPASATPQASATPEATPTISVFDSRNSEGPTPTSNVEALQLLQTNPTLLVSIEMRETCFVEGEPIPFRLIGRNLADDAIYFYTEGSWQFSINNGDVGPVLASRVPTLTEEFDLIEPNSIYVRDEEDLGLWVQSLGPEYRSFATETGFGLPQGDYWVTFLYTNDQDGLTEQPDETFLIERAAWTGTAVSFELRFRVAEEECEE